MHDINFCDRGHQPEWEKKYIWTQTHKQTK